MSKMSTWGNPTTVPDGSTGYPKDIDDWIRSVKDDTYETMLVGHDLLSGINKIYVWTTAARNSLTTPATYTMGYNSDLQLIEYNSGTSASPVWTPLQIVPYLSSTSISALTTPPAGMIVYDLTHCCFKRNKNTAASPTWQVLSSIPVYATADRPTTPDVATGTIYYDSTLKCQHIYKGAGVWKAIGNTLDFGNGQYTIDSPLSHVFTLDAPPCPCNIRLNISVLNRSTTGQVLTLAYSDNSGSTYTTAQTYTYAQTTVSVIPMFYIGNTVIARTKWSITASTPDISAPFISWEYVGAE